MGGPPAASEAQRRAWGYTSWAGGAALEKEFSPVGGQLAYLLYTVHASSTMLRQVLHERVANP